MSLVKSLRIEGCIFAVSKEKYSYSMIQKLSDMHGIKISNCKMSNIRNRKGEKPPFIFSYRKEDSKLISKEDTYTVSTLFIASIKTPITRENSPT